MPTVEQNVAIPMAKKDRKFFNRINAFNTNPSFKSRGTARSTELAKTVVPSSSSSGVASLSSTSLDRTICDPTTHTQKSTSFRDNSKVVVNQLKVREANDHWPQGVRPSIISPQQSIQTDKQNVKISHVLNDCTATSPSALSAASRQCLQSAMVRELPQPSLTVVITSRSALRTIIYSLQVRTIIKSKSDALLVLTEAQMRNLTDLGIRSDSLWRLASSRWLNDEIINGFSKLIQRSMAFPETIACMNSFFVHELLTSGNSGTEKRIAVGIIFLSTCLISE